MNFALRRREGAPTGYVAAMGNESDLEALREGLKRVGVALKESGRPFALAGGYAAWVRGSPEPLHDVDFLVRPEHREAVAEELRQRGLEVEEPAEDWLFKVRVDGVTVDVLHRAQGSTVEEVLAGATVESVLSVRLPVVSATDVTVEKLLALDEHYCDLAAVLPTLRALREQVDWPVVARRTSGQPFAEAVLFLSERLGLVESADQAPAT
jgi:hypothetical protein